MTELVFRKPNGAPVCPVCSASASIQHYRLPAFGHYCDARGVNTYWTTNGLDFLRLGIIIDLLEFEEVA